VAIAVGSLVAPTAAAERAPHHAQVIAIAAGEHRCGALTFREIAVNTAVLLARGRWQFGFIAGSRRGPGALGHNEAS